MKLKNTKIQSFIADFSNLKITVDVSKLPPLKPSIQNTQQKVTKKIRAVDPDAEKKFADMLKSGKLIFETLEKFRIEVKENVENKERDKLDIKVNDKSFSDVDVMWIGCGKDYDYYDDMSYPEHLGNSVLFVKNNICISVSTDIRQFTLQKGEKVVRYVSTIDDKDCNLRSSGFIKTNLGYYALSSFNNRDGFLPKQFVSSSLNDEYRFRLLRWTNIYPYGQVKKIKVEFLTEAKNLKNDIPNMKKDNPNLQKWFS